MSADSLHFAGVVLITVPAIAFGGARQLTMIFRRDPGYLDNPLRQNLWRAGHAHAGVLVILTLVALLLVDRADLSGALCWLIRYALVAAPILMALGFFLSLLHPRASKSTAEHPHPRSGRSEDVWAAGPRPPACLSGCGSSRLHVGRSRRSS